MAQSDKPDILVIGGGPAGLAMAIAARLKGFEVTLADSAIPPIEKPCGEGLMPDSLAVLKRLGVDPQSLESFPFRGIRFAGPAARVDASFPHGSGLGVRRPILHRALVQRAIEIGITLRWGTPIRGLSGQTVHLQSGEQLTAQWIIGADGYNSPVRQWAGLSATRRESRRFGFRRHYRVAPWTDCMEIYWGPGCQAYVTPVGTEEVCVACMSTDKHLRLGHALARIPELKQRLANAPISSPERGAVTVSRSLRRIYGNNVVLVGDASGSVDAITGEGLCLAFQHALLAADAIATGNLAHYQSEHRKLAWRPELMARLMLSLNPVPAFRNRVLAALSSRPEIFAHMLSMHVGEISPADFLFQAILPLGWRMLTV